MIDFGNLLDEFDNDEVIFPKEIFEANIRTKKFSYLRGDQEKILEKWFKKRNQKDNIIKMNTGGGKTTVGLLQLQSSLNEGIGPALYLCLDNQLIHQVIRDAEGLGVKCVEISHDNTFPGEFLNSEAILVTTFQKLFNAKSIFGIQGDTSREIIELGCIVIDDAHSALLKAKEAFTLKFPRENVNYDLIVNSFKDSLFGQAMGSTDDILTGRDKYGILMIPYWSWIEKLPDIIDKINKEDETVKFKWQLIRDYLEQCMVLVSYPHVEITPNCLPIHMIHGYANAQRRIFMSATLNDDSSLIKDFGVQKQAILSPIQSSTFSDIGEKLIIAPFNVDSSLNSSKWATILSKLDNHNIVSLVSSDSKSERWINNGFLKPTPQNIREVLSNLTQGQGEHIVLSNRYDGLDLAEDACHILVIDDLPQSSSLIERYSIFARPSSKIMNMNQAQKIEQGLGRAVRSVNDYAIIFLLGRDLVSKLSNKQFQKFMSPQTVNQIQLGSKVVELIKKDAETPVKAIGGAMKQILDRDPSWIQLHKKQISKVSNIEIDDNLVSISEIETRAFKQAISGQYLQASETIRTNIKILSNSSEAEEGWYAQLAASYLYKIDRQKSMELQLFAHSKNSYLLKPPLGVNYRKLTTKTTMQASKIKKFISEFLEPNSIILKINSILENLLFAQDSSAAFEKAFSELGNCLGFEAHQPDKEFSIGPDVLWNLYNDEYLIIEAKNEVDLSRKEVYKSETAQISEGMNWFEQEYANKIGIPVLIHPTNKLHKEAFGPPSLKFLTNDKLQMFKENVRGFYGKLATRSLEQWDLRDLTIELKNYQLDSQSIKNYFILKNN